MISIPSPTIKGNVSYLILRTCTEMTKHQVYKCLENRAKCPLLNKRSRNMLVKLCGPLPECVIMGGIVISMIQVSLSSIFIGY